jgi:hypothetical protein
MPGNPPRQDLIGKSPVKIMDVNPWPLDADEAATSGP